MWNLKCDTDKPTYEAETDSQTEKRPVAADGEGKGQTQFEVSRCTPLYLEWINNRSYCIAQGTISSLLGSTIVEKNIKQECICM